MNKMSRTPVAVSYARFSSGKQAKGSSIDRQTSAFFLWLERHREFQSLSFEDRGVSAFKGKNATKGGLAEVLQLIQQGALLEGDCLVIESMDRISRQEVSESLALVQDILKAGLRIVTLEDQQAYDRSSLNDSRGFVLLANLQAAHNYSKRLGERVKAAHDSKRAKARAHQPPKSIVTARWIKDGRLQEPFAGLVLKAIELYLAGFGHRAIAIELQKTINEDQDLQAQYPKPLHASTIKRWLRSPELVGDWGSKDGLIEGIFEPLISHVNFGRVQEEARRRYKSPKKQGNYLLSGLVICAECDATFHTRRQKPRPTKSAPIGTDEYNQKPRILYCNCSNYLKNGSCANNSTWPYEVLLFIHWYGLSVPLFQLDKAEKESGLNKESLELQNELAELKAKSSRFEELYVETGNKSHLDRVKELAERIAALTAKLGENVQRKVSAAESDQLISAFNHFEQLDEVERNARLKRNQYFIFIERKKAVLARSFSQPTFELVRRSQKYGVYIVRVERDANENRRESRYFAIKRTGETLFPDNIHSEEELMARLERSAIDGNHTSAHFGIFE